MESVRAELIQRGLVAQIYSRITWTAMIKLLKYDEKDSKYFKSVTNYDTFKWNTFHFDADGEVM